MDAIMHFFSINNTFFALWDYQMSYIEFFGTILNIWCVWLVAKRNILTWPVGIAAVVLFMALFYQIRLYSDFVEQIYYIITGFYGWWLWKKNADYKKEEEVKVEINSPAMNAAWAAIIIAGTLLAGKFIGDIHVYFPDFFPEPASFPYLDAFTTVMSFAAQILLARRKVESWALWIVVDVIGIWLYYAKGVIFVSLLYLIFLCLAAKGLAGWYATWKRQNVKQLAPEEA